MQFSIKHLLLTDAEALECAAVQILVWHASSCNRQTVALVITSNFVVYSLCSQFVLCLQLQQGLALDQEGLQLWGPPV